MNRWIGTAAVCGALTCVLVLLVLFADVAAIGPEGTQVGLSGFNAGVHALTGVSFDWYTFTERLGYGVLLVPALFGLQGLGQFLRRKSLRKVDREILLLGALYLVTLGLYVFFELVPVSYRPVLMPDGTGPEPSFPSSHTMLALVVLGSAAMVVDRYVEHPTARWALKVLCGALMGVMLLGRFLSGVHWATDILGGILMSGALLALFRWELGRKKE